MYRNIICTLALGMSMWAQSPALSGKFVLAEEAPDSITLGLFTFDASGNVSGTEYVQASGVTKFISITGTYLIAADGSGTLTLNTEVATEDGDAPAVAATYDFASARAGGFSAVRREGTQASVAHILPAGNAKALAASYDFETEGTSRSGQRVAALGVLSAKGDGSFSGKLSAKRAAISELAVVSGTYIVESSGFGRMRLTIPGASDEDGNAVTTDSAYIFLVTSKQEIIALGVENALPGLARMTAAQ